MARHGRGQARTTAAHGTSTARGRSARWCPRSSARPSAAARPPTAQVLADWEAIVGPALAAVTTPRKLFSGTLSIVCAGPVAMELQHLSEPLMARINGHLGQVAVDPAALHPGHSARAPAAPPPPRPPAIAAARRAVASLPAATLRDALESLGRVVLSDGED